MLFPDLLSSFVLLKLLGKRSIRCPFPFPFANSFDSSSCSLSFQAVGWSFVPSLWTLNCYRCTLHSTHMETKILGQPSVISSGYIAHNCEPKQIRVAFWLCRNFVCLVEFQFCGAVRGAQAVESRCAFDELGKQEKCM